MRVGRFTTFALIVIVGTAGRGTVAAVPASPPMPFTLNDAGQVLVPVRINGAGPFQFILDTGANRSAISDAVAARLSLQAVARAELVTTTGSERRTIVGIERLSVGSHDTPAVQATVIAAGQLRDIDARADGVVGQDVLIDAHYTLDYRRRTLTWLDPGADSGPGVRIALRREEGRLLAELPHSSDRGDVVLMVPDSGASTLVLFLRNGRTAIPATPLAGMVETTTVTGDARLQAASVPKLRIGTHTWWDRPALLVTTSAGAEASRVDGLLPLSWFSSVTFNGREYYVVARR